MLRPVWEAVPAVIVAPNPLKIAMFLASQFLKIIPPPFGEVCYEKMQPVFSPLPVFLAGLVFLTELASLVLGKPVVSLNICSVKSRRDGLVRCGILIGISSTSSPQFAI